MSEVRYAWKHMPLAVVAIFAMVVGLLVLFGWLSVRLPEMAEYENKCHAVGGVMVKNTCMDPSSVIRFK